jgi:cytochrome c
MSRGKPGSQEGMIETSASRHRGRPVGRPGGLAFAWVAAVLLAPGNALADAGALYREKGCVACHGADGSHPVSPDYPVIAGQNPSYLLRQMKDIRDGARSNGLAGVMRATVREVSDEDFAAIAQWLAKKW